MTLTNQTEPTDDFLCHHGILGQKKGIRRYQNPDGSLTPLGRRHWGVGPPRKKTKSFRLETEAERKDRLAIKKQKKQEKALRTAVKKAVGDEELKAKLIANANKDEIYKNRNLFSDDELREAINRVEMTERIKPRDVKEEPKKTEPKKTEFKWGSSKKDRIAANGNMEEIYKNRKLFTDEELRAAINRAEMLQKLDPKKKKDAVNAPQKTGSGKSFADKTIDGIGKATKIATGVGGLAIAGWTAYNQIASITNTASGTFLSDDSKKEIKDKLVSKVNSSKMTPITSSVISFMADAIDGSLPVGTIDPYNKLKNQKAKTYNKKQFSSLFPDGTDQNIIDDLFDKVYG